MNRFFKTDSWSKIKMSDGIKIDDNNKYPRFKKGDYAWQLLIHHNNIINFEYKRVIIISDCTDEYYGWSYMITEYKEDLTDSVIESLMRTDYPEKVEQIHLFESLSKLKKFAKDIINLKQEILETELTRIDSFFDKGENRTEQIDKIINDEI